VTTLFIEIDFPFFLLHIVKVLLSAKESFYFAKFILKVKFNLYFG